MWWTTGWEVWGGPGVSALEIFNTNRSGMYLSMRNYSVREGPAVGWSSLLKSPACFLPRREPTSSAIIPILLVWPQPRLTHPLVWACLSASSGSLTLISISLSLLFPTSFSPSPFSFPFPQNFPSSHSQRSSILPQSLTLSLVPLCRLISLGMMNVTAHLTPRRWMKNLCYQVSGILFGDKLFGRVFLW